MPLREDIVQAAGTSTPTADLYAHMGLSAGKPVLLVFGGSQGARFLNDLMARAVGLLGDGAGRFQLLHLTGTDNNDALLAAYRQAGLNAWVRRAESHIENCYRVADLVLCRAGASTISELALFGKPAVLVPLPSAAEDHQTVNARVLADAGAARLLPQAEATPNTVAELLGDWLKAPQTWTPLGQRLRDLACPQAAAAVVDVLLETLGAAPERRAWS